VRPAKAEIDLDAIAANVRLLRQASSPAELMAVVKADGYGHGAVPIARAVVDAGATWLGVAMVDEAIVLRDHGIEAPILVLSEPRPSEMPAAVEQRVRVAVYTEAGIAAAAAAAEVAGAVLPVHLKIDTGMRRVGAPPEEAAQLASAVDAQASLELEGLWTHCAVADEPENEFTAVQIERFDEVLSAVIAAGVTPRLVHAANSAAAMAHPTTRFDVVRCGIALYGIAPSSETGDLLDLRPALRLVSEVTFVKRVPAGEGVSYGLRYTTARDTVLATIPIGYADGVPRRLFEVGGEVLIRGQRLPIVGVVTMDQLMIDAGDADVMVGDEVVLIGAQGDEEITANEWGDRLGTIGYEIVCGISARVPRVYR
jgi:alanine racemase